MLDTQKTYRTVPSELPMPSMASLWWHTFVALTVMLGLIKAQEGQVNLVEESARSQSLTRAVVYGERFTSQTDPSRYGFGYYGIRYGNAGRFEHSTENMDFSYLTNSSRPKLGPICPQASMMGPPGMPGMAAPKTMSEDCLYLDVYVPSSAPNGRGRLLPVMMWIYGGALQLGDKDSYNASSLAESIQAVVVTVNYRVNVFGFLSTADRVASGNYGVGDCKLALRWIKRNIFKFGGDPNAVTVFGESAGGTLTSTLLLDPDVRGQIRGIVAMSGSVMVDTLYIRDPRKEAFALGAQVGCPNGTTSQLISCLNQVPMQQLVQAATQGPMTLAQRFGLVIDHEHIKDLPVRALQHEIGPFNTPNILHGYLREDIAGLMQLMYRDLFDPSKPLTLDTVREMVARQFLLTSTGSGVQCTQPNYALANKVMQHFNMTGNETRQELLWKLFHLGSESQFGYPAAKEVAFYAQRHRPSPPGRPGPGFGPSSQLFLISYDAGSGTGAYHGMDVQHIFGQSTPFGQPPNPAVTNGLRLMLQQMAYYGRMDGPDFSQGGASMELNQSGQWQRGTNNNWEMIRFWDEIANTPCIQANNFFQAQ